MTFISVAGGMLFAFLIFGALAVIYSCLRSYQIRMMRVLRTVRYKIDDLQRLLDEQDECLFNIGQRLSDIEAERKGSHRSTAARPSGSAVSADDSSLMPRQGSTFRQ